MSVKRLSNLKLQYDDGNGVLASNYRLFFYAAGSSTKQNTYNSSSGGVANTNPVVLNALGEPAVEIWLTSGLTYKMGLAIPGSDDPPAAFVWTEDNISGVNDTAAPTTDEWITPALTPTFVSATSFSLAGDQTTEFHVGRRVKTTNSGGTRYSTISVSAFGALTTVTVVNDSGVLDSGLSAVSYGIVRATNPSIARLNGALTLTGALDLSASGAGQIAFPATQNPSSNVNTLDDYEEGTWTPGLAFGGSSVGVTYTTQTGQYTKIGNRVFTQFEITLSSKGALANAMTLTGLPFTAANLAATVGSFYPVRWDNTSAIAGMWIGAIANSTTAQFYEIAGATANVVNFGFTFATDTTTVRGSLHYQV